MRDDARLGDRREDVGGAAHDVFPAENVRQDLFGFDAVLERDYRGVLADQRLNGASGRLRVPHLDVEHDDV